MKEYKVNAEDRGRFSAAPDDWGALYRQAADSLEMDIPLDMADRIMAGLEELEQEPRELHSIVPEVSGGGTPVLRLVPAGLARKGKTITASFAKYAANIAACFVLALGLFTMNSAAGRGIIGLGTGENTSVIPEIPVKAHSKTEQFDEEQIPLAAPELNDPIPPYVGEQPSLKVETEEGNKKTTEEDPEASARSDAAPERKIPEAGDNSGEGSENRRIDSGGTAGSSGFADDPDSGGSASSPVERVETPSSGNSAPQIIIGDSSGGNVPDQGQDYQIPENSDRQTLDYPSVYPDEPESTPGTDVQLPEEPSGNTDPPLVFDSTHPVKELADISQLADVMGYQPAVVSPVPEGWGISSIEVIWGITAQITYSDGLDSVLYRTSAGASILNSDSGTYTSRIELGGYILEGDSEDSVSLITWTSGDSSYSMFFDRPVSQPEGLNWAGSVM